MDVVLRGVKGCPVCFRIFLPGFEVTVIPTISTCDAVKSTKNYIDTYDHNQQFFLKLSSI